MAETITGKVAKIVDESTVVINVGSKDGVKGGMRFLIVAEGDEVKDPDSGDLLGKWEIVKGRIVVSHAQDRLAVCVAEPQAGEEGQKPRTLSAAMVEVSMPRAQVGAKAKLNVRPSEVSGGPSVGPIVVGDKVRSVAS